MNDMKVPKRIATSIINSLQGGVTPPTGLGYYAVGREQEINALLKDLEIINDGGATFRLLIGKYGSGKTFLLHTIKEHAIAQGFVVSYADLSPERNLSGNNVSKKGLATYRELLGNMCIKSSPTGAGLEKILDGWINGVWMEVAQAMSGGAISGTDLEAQVNKRIYATINEMQSMVHGFDFSTVLLMYWRASRAGDQETKSKTLKWLRGEYWLKTDARRELGIQSIINDDDWFDYIKLFARLLHNMNYKGFIIMIDELVNISKSVMYQTRQRNYEKMLSMYNDALQGRASYLGIIMGGTPSSVENRDTGVFSYEALRSRLQSGTFGDNAIINLMTPIIRIKPLTKSEIVVLLEKLSSIHADVYQYASNISSDDIIYFVDAVYSNRIVTDVRPRGVIRDFIDVLNLLMQHKDLDIRTVIENYQWHEDVEEEIPEIED